MVRNYKTTTDRTVMNKTDKYATLPQAADLLQETPMVLFHACKKGILDYAIDPKGHNWLINISKITGETRELLIGFSEKLKGRRFRCYYQVTILN